jgi:hypothetical protein
MRRLGEIDDVLRGKGIGLEAVVGKALVYRLETGGVGSNNIYSGTASEGRSEDNIDTEF